MFYYIKVLLKSFIVLIRNNNLNGFPFFCPFKQAYLKHLLRVFCRKAYLFLGMKSKQSAYPNILSSKIHYHHSTKTILVPSKWQWCKLIYFVIDNKNMLIWWRFLIVTNTENDASSIYLKKIVLIFTLNLVVASYKATTIKLSHIYIKLNFATAN